MNKAPIEPPVGSVAVLPAGTPADFCGDRGWPMTLQRSPRGWFYLCVGWTPTQVNDFWERYGETPGITIVEATG